MTILNLKPDPSPQGEQSIRRISFQRIIPNLMTLTAIAAGLTSLQFAIDMKWDRAVMALLVALVLDGMDGATARLLKVNSEFGAILDTLSDFLAFGVAPAVVLYTWVLTDSGRIGWMAMIFYTSATALRLARFTVEQKKLPDWHKGFFSGVPSPAGAGLALLPLIFWFHYPSFFRQFSYESPLVGLWIIIVGSLMVSRIPTFSLKAVKIPSNMVMMVMAGVALLLAGFASAPWTTLVIVGLMYMASIPVSVICFRKLQRNHQLDNDLVNELGDLQEDDQ
jgi:CDP-diacylglycerol--serine O-phosphatidyltransferase